MLRKSWTLSFLHLYSMSFRIVNILNPISQFAAQVKPALWLARLARTRVPWVQFSCRHCCCQVMSAVSDSVQPHRQQPTRLPRPWDSRGKNTGVGCHFLLQFMKVKSESEVARSCPTLSDPMDCSLPGSSIHGIFQAGVLEWVAIAFSPVLLKAV